MPFVAAYLNSIIDGVADDITGLSAHTADPGTTGANEHGATGSPAYARKTPVWNAAVSGVAQLTAPVVFDVFNATITHIGMWKGSTWVGAEELSSPRTFTGQDTLTLNQFTLA